MESFDQDKFDERLLLGVQVWPCSLWRNEWRGQFSLNEMGCGELLSIEQPSLVQAEQISILAAGADALVTGTFGANAIVMGSYGAQSKVQIANRESARITLEVSQKEVVEGNGPLVLGSLGPTTCLLSLNRDRRELIHSVYLEQAEALWTAGIKAFHIEGFRDPENLYCALEVLDELELKTATRLLRVITVRVEHDGAMLSGTSVNECWKKARQFRPRAFGVVGQREGLERCLRDLSPEVDIPLIAMVDIRALNSPEMAMLHSDQSFASCLLDFTTRFNLTIVGPGVESHPGFLFSLHQLLVSSGLKG